MYIFLVLKVWNFLQLLLLSKENLGEVSFSMRVLLSDSWISWISTNTNHRSLDNLIIEQIKIKNQNHPRPIFVERLVQQHFWRQKYDCPLTLPMDSFHLKMTCGKLSFIFWWFTYLHTKKCCPSFGLCPNYQHSKLLIIHNSSRQNTCFVGHVYNLKTV